MVVLTVVACSCTLDKGHEDEPLPGLGKRDIAPTHVPRLPRPSTALYIRFLTWAWTFMTLGSDVTVKNTPLSANFSALGAMILHLALQGLSRQM